MLSQQLRTFGQAMLARYGERVHKISLNASFTCPNRDGSKGRGGCTFCNNVSFNPNGRSPDAISAQLEAGRRVIRKRTGARKYIAYFQAYTNTYADIEHLSDLYGQALSEPDIIGLSVGTRPDCVPDAVLDLLASYQDSGYETWLELGLQSAFDETLARVNRGHGFSEYRDTVSRARARGLQVCTHLIIGLPGETITIKDGKIHISDVNNANGFTLSEDLYLPDTFTHGSETIELGPTNYYILGDNRSASLDSRTFGPIEKSDIIGRTWIRGWPFSRLEIFNDPAY